MPNQTPLLNANLVVDNTTTNYLCDGLSTMRETDGTGSLVADYTTNPTKLVGQIISRTDASGNTMQYSTDGLGSTVNLTDTAETVTSGYSYDSFGNVVAHAGDDATYTFSTKEQDTTGLDYFAARYYDPETGRFISNDGLMPNLYNPQTINRYTFCGNDPINRIDANGKDWLNIGLGTGSTVAGIGYAAAWLGGGTALGVSAPVWGTAALVLGAAGIAYTGYQYATGQVTSRDALVSTFFGFYGMTTGPIGWMFSGPGLAWEGVMTYEEYQRIQAKCRGGGW